MDNAFIGHAPALLKSLFLQYLIQGLALHQHELAGFKELGTHPAGNDVRVVLAYALGIEAVYGNVDRVLGKSSAAEGNDQQKR